MKAPFQVLIIAIFIIFYSCNPKENTTTIDDFEKFKAEFSSSGGWGSLSGVKDFSAESFQNNYDETKKQLDKLRGIDSAQLNFQDKIDWKFAESILIGRALEQGKMEFWKKDPRQYMAFRSIGNTIGKSGDPVEKANELIEKLKLVPIQLENGKKQLEVYVPRFQELAIFMAENARNLFESEIPEFSKQLETVKSEEIKELSSNSLEALEGYILFLKEELPNRVEGDFAVGEEVYTDMLKGKFLLDFTPAELYDFGWEQFRKTQDELTALAEQIDKTKTWQELIIEIKNNYPDANKMIEAHQHWVDKSKEHILENDLMPIPWKEKVTVVPRAEYLRKTSYYGNFSRAREANTEGVFEAQWMINPFEDQWDQETKDRYMVEHDWGVIIVTAPHESYGGHHVQGLYQMHNPSKIRQENGISLFSEGWGLYNEQLMQETGFFPNDSIYLRQLQLRLWRNARVIYDVGLHTKRLSYEDAIELMEKEVGFLRWAAQLEIDGATSSPGYYIGYFLGMHQLLELREDYKSKMGEDYSIKDYHVKVLEAGNMPMKLMREVVMN